MSFEVAGLVGMPVQFLRDPTNPHDRYCVEVFLCGCKLGHVARTSSMEISLLLQRSYDVNRVSRANENMYIQVHVHIQSINQPVECSQMRKQCTIILRCVCVSSCPPGAYNLGMD